MNALSNTAMILAAGIGSRMRPLTLTTPKPLVEIGGRTMLDRALDRLVEIHIQRAVVNVFHLADKIEAHLRTRKDIEIIISRETKLLETGGGIKHALTHFGGLPFFAINADLPWIDQGTPSLARMRDTWRTADMDALLLLKETAQARGFGTDGDFAMSDAGRVTRIGVTPPRPYVFLAAQISKPELFAAIPDKAFSNNRIWNNAEARGRLYGIAQQGSCFHVGTMADIDDANALLAGGTGWAVA